ncbi:MAG TPA: phosphoribosylanthranilate isomerase [Verrucomicrobiota bacterium]|nr:phosphoribosylanthranilate isomerase [Verrucomicrobiota bacterium]
MNIRPRIKICCIRDAAEAQLAVQCGVAAVGLVSAMPSGPGVIEEDSITQIAATIPPGVATFLLTSLRDAESIVAQQRRCRVNTLQLCDLVEAGCHAKLRMRLPGIALVQVIHVTGWESLDEALAVAREVDALLLDSGNQKLAVKELGGTGRTHDWSVSRAIVEAVPLPVFLAGGLNADNVAQAIRQVRPFGLDVCSGVRSNGRLDEEKLKRFIENAGAITA